MRANAAAASHPCACRHARSKAAMASAMGAPTRSAATSPDHLPFHGFNATNRALDAHRVAAQAAWLRVAPRPGDT